MKRSQHTNKHKKILNACLKEEDLMYVSLNHRIHTKSYNSCRMYNYLAIFNLSFYFEQTSTATIFGEHGIMHGSYTMMI